MSQVGDIRIPAAVYAQLSGDPFGLVAFVGLVARAALCACVRVVAGREVSLGAGELLTSIEAFAAETSLTPNHTRGAWNRLTKLGLIHVQAHRRGHERGTRITVRFLAENTAESTDVHVQHHEQNHENNPQDLTYKVTYDSTYETTNALLLSRSSDLGSSLSGSDLRSEISGSSDPGSGDLCSSELPESGLPRDRQQPAVRLDVRAKEQARLLRVIGAEHRAAHSRMRSELGFAIPGARGYVPAMQAIGDPAERALRELIAAQATLDGFEERARHVLAVAEHEARSTDPPSLKWFGASLWSERSFGRAVSMAVGEDRKPARASPRERMSPTEEALQHVRELQEAERRAAESG